MEKAGKFSRGGLLVINVVFMLLGIGFLVVGIIMQTNNKVLGEEEIIATLNEVELSASVKLGNLASSLSLFVIVLGSFTMFVSLLGCLGAACKNRILLFIFAIVVLMIFIAQLVFVIMWIIQKEQVENFLLDKLTTVLKIYDGILSTDEKSTGWDYIFIDFECCGVKSVSASNDQEFSNSKWWSSRGSDKVPMSCCNGATKSNYKALSANTACTQALTDHKTTGCYTAFKEWAFEYEIPSIIIGVAILLCEVFAIIFAFILCKKIKKSNKIY